MDDDIFFVDMERGIFGGRNGNLYLTDSNTCNLKDDPFVVPYPYRIVVKEEYDPYAIIFTESGYIYILNFQTLKWHLKVLLPPDIGVIDSLEIRDDGESVFLKSNQISYLYQNGWINLPESFESLIVKEDQKVFAQSTQLENEICSAKLCGDLKQFRKAMKRYLIYLANYTSNDTFIQIWYDVINQKYPFDPDDIHQVWIKCINYLSTLNSLSSLIDEIKMSVGE